MTSESEDVLLAKGYRYMRDGLPEKSGPYHTQGYFRRSRETKEMRLYWNAERLAWRYSGTPIDEIFIVTMWKAIND